MCNIIPHGNPEFFQEKMQVMHLTEFWHPSIFYLEKVTNFAVCDFTFLVSQDKDDAQISKPGFGNVKLYQYCTVAIIAFFMAIDGKTGGGFSCLYWLRMQCVIIGIKTHLIFWVHVVYYTSKITKQHRHRKVAWVQQLAD